MDVYNQNKLSEHFKNMSSNFTNHVSLTDISADNIMAASVIGILLSLMCISGIVGNFYTLVVMCMSMTTVTSMYSHIVNLALADLLYLLTIPFIVHNSFVKDWYFGEIGCRVILSLDLLTMHASIFILTIMSTERYIAVAKPFNAVRRSRSYKKTLACAIWILSFLLTLPMMLMIHQEERMLDNGSIRKLCTPTWSDEHYKIYLTVLFTSSILAPGLIIGYLYSKLARVYWISQTKSPLNKEVQRSPKQKVILMIFIIVLAFWACFLPFWIWQLIPLYSYGGLKVSVQTEIYVNNLVTCLTYGNSCINPFLYTLLTKNYKEYVCNRQRGGHGSLGLKSGAGYSENSAKKTVLGKASNAQTMLRSTVQVETPNPSEVGCINVN